MDKLEGYKQLQLPSKWASVHVLHNAQIRGAALLRPTVFALLCGKWTLFEYNRREKQILKILAWEAVFIQERSRRDS